MCARVCVYVCVVLCCFSVGMINKNSNQSIFTQCKILTKETVLSTYMQTHTDTHTHKYIDYKYTTYVIST